MNATETAQVLETLLGYWPTSDQRAAGMARWLSERKVEHHDARAALASLAEQYDQLPSIKQLGVKLAEIGASTKPQLGVGDVRIVAGMKQRFRTYAIAATQWGDKPSLMQRLTEEQETTRVYLEEAERDGLEAEQIGYYRDSLTALGELVNEEMA